MWIPGCLEATAVAIVTLTQPQQAPTNHNHNKTGTKANTTRSPAWQSCTGWNHIPSDVEIVSLPSWTTQPTWCDMRWVVLKTWEIAELKHGLIYHSGTAVILGNNQWSSKLNSANVYIICALKREFPNGDIQRTQLTWYQCDTAPVLCHAPSRNSEVIDLLAFLQLSVGLADLPTGYEHPNADSQSILSFSQFFCCGVRGGTIIDSD